MLFIIFLLSFLSGVYTLEKNRTKLVAFFNANFFMFFEIISLKRFSPYSKRASVSSNYSRIQPKLTSVLL